MKRQIHFLEYLYCLLLLVFFLGRVVFLVYNKDIASFSFMDALAACKEGLFSHDIFLTAILLLIPWLAALYAVRHPQFPLRKCLVPYYVILGILAGIIIVADIVMYEFWQFKLSSVVASYALSPEGATNSVSLLFIAARVMLALTFILLLIIPSILLTPKHFEPHPANRFWMRNISIIFAFFMVAGGLFMRVGSAYFSSDLFLNHAAVNPVLSFTSSIPLRQGYAHRGEYLPESDRASLFKDLYPADTEDISDTLLTTERPNILFVFMESFGGKFVKELGGLPEVAPCLSRLIPQGIFWENYYSNSFRTDRGTVSTYGGMVSYPDVCLMKHSEWNSQMPSIAKSLNAEGYATSYLYAGAMTNMGKRTYLEDAGFSTLLDHTSFSPQENTGSWGVDDHISAHRTFQLIAQKDTMSHWMMAYQTLSSHEPWTVPYHRLEDPKLNSFAYTDQCVGDLVDSLRTLPQWDNMLVIILPDHGFLYEQSFQDPEFFHSPMLWLGGAIKSPRRMSVLMNQSDICATLLSQMRLSHAAYPWSRNVLSRNYSYPFVYCNFPAGILFRDSTGTSIFDITADEPIYEDSDVEGLRTLRAKSILQTSYDMLQELP